MRLSELRLVHDGRHELGEGPLWHDGIGRLFWFSILEGVMHSCDADGGERRDYRMGERASAAGIIDDATLLVATETGLWRLDLGAGEKSLVAPLEADNPRTRSNDGRTAPDGSFWIGTMGRRAERYAGAIYRFRADGEPPVRSVARRVTIPNAISFSPDGTRAYWCDTREARIMRMAVDPVSGEPEGEAAVHVDLREEGLNPDGAVVDAQGCLWNAQWGAGRVARYDPDGAFMGEARFPVSQVSCPVFGGPDMTTLFVTTAWEGLGDEGREENAGCVFAVETDVAGLPAPRIRPVP